jgi:hypothetical protein
MTGTEREKERDEVLKRMLKMPPEPHKARKSAKKKIKKVRKTAIKDSAQ